MTATPIRLVIFDMEGTLTANPTLWELMHLKVGTWESHGQLYWQQYKAGHFDYDRFACMDVACWKGAPLALFDQAVAEVPLMPGCAELLGCLRERGVRTAIVSNGLERLGLRLARDFGMARVCANREVVHDDCLTGGLDILVPFQSKADAMLRIAKDLGIPASQTLAVGDGPADIAMFERAGRSVAFLPESDRVASAATHVVRQPDLRHLLPLIW